jgi:thymidylate synthase (FAD)
MDIVEPKVFIIGETRVVKSGLDEYLKWVGTKKWRSDAPSDSEKLVEVMGRLCYRSFEPGLNPNVTKVRKSNEEYVSNILKVQHGSVLEHSSVNFVFADVSRVFTHELVRHRVGTAISQESLRFVRLTDLDAWMPTVISENEEAMAFMCNCFEEMERWQTELTEILGVEEMKNFNQKKVATSAMRRIAPIGLATSIGWSANMRTIRHCIEMRTEPHAEEEIRDVFGKVGLIMRERYPNLFGDYEVEMVDGYPHFKTQNRKV